MIGVTDSARSPEVESGLPNLIRRTVLPTKTVVLFSSLLLSSPGFADRRPSADELPRAVLVSHRHVELENLLQGHLSVTAGI